MLVAVAAVFATLILLLVIADIVNESRSEEPTDCHAPATLVDWGEGYNCVIGSQSFED